MPVEYVLLLVGVGFVSAIINIMAGGGSLLALPALVFMGLPGPVANGSNRLAVLLQTGISTWQFYRDGYSNFRLSLTLTLFALPGTVLGAWAGVHLAGAWFNRVLAAVIILVMILMARRPERKAASAPGVAAPVSRKRSAAAHLLMIPIGFFGGFIQAGVGFVIMMALHRVLRMDLVHVNMHKVFIVSVYTIAALLIFALNGEVNWLAGLVLGAGGVAGGIVGTKLTVTKGEKFIRIFLYVVLVAMIIKLLFP